MEPDVPAGKRDRGDLFKQAVPRRRRPAMASTTEAGKGGGGAGCGDGGGGGGAGAGDGGGGDAGGEAHQGKRGGGGPPGGDGGGGGGGGGGGDAHQGKLGGGGGGGGEAHQGKRGGGGGGGEAHQGKRRGGGGPLLGGVCVVNEAHQGKRGDGGYRWLTRHPLLHREHRQRFGPLLPLYNPIPDSDREEDLKPEIETPSTFRFGTKMKGKRLAIPRLRVSSTPHGNHNSNKEKMDLQYVGRNITWGIHNSTLTYMILALVAFNILVPFLKLTSVRMDDPIAVIWRMSLFICTQLFFLILSTRTTTGVIDIFSRIFIGFLLAFVATGLVTELSGVAVAHISTAWASGMFGYSLAEYRQSFGTENAAHVAVALIPNNQSKKQKRLKMYTFIHCAFTVSLVLICFAVRLVWLVLLPAYNDGYYMVLELSFLIWWILYFCLLIISPLMLHGVVISTEQMLPIIAFHIGSYPISLLFFLISQVVWVYYFALQVFILAAVIGYILSIHSHYLQLVAGGRRKNPKMLIRTVVPSRCAGTNVSGNSDITGTIVSGNSEITAPFREDIRAGADENSEITAFLPKYVTSSVENSVITADVREDAAVLSGDGPCTAGVEEDCMAAAKLTAIPSKQFKSEITAPVREDIRAADENSEITAFLPKGITSSVENSVIRADVREDAAVLSGDRPTAGVEEDVMAAAELTAIPSKQFKSEITAIAKKDVPSLAGNRPTAAAEDVTATTEVTPTTVPSKQNKRKEPCVVSSKFCRGKGIVGGLC